MIFSLVTMTGLEKFCITSAYLQWLCHSGERPVVRGPLFFFFFYFIYLFIYFFFFFHVYLLYVCVNIVDSYFVVLCIALWLLAAKSSLFRPDLCLVIVFVSS